MDSILKDLELDQVTNNFKNEGVTPTTVLQLSSEELSGLGINRLGDQIRLKEACKKFVEKDTTRYAPSTVRERILQERNHLFSPYRSSASSKKRVRVTHKSTAGRPWTANIYCLSSPFQMTIPTPKEKETLQFAGLGAKKIKFLMDEDEQTLYEKLTSDEIGFPKLKKGGGFELLRCVSNTKDLAPIRSGTFNVKDIRSSLGSPQSKIYVRPIQMPLDTTPIITENVSTLKEKCIHCGEYFLLKELRKHSEEHVPALNYPDSSSSDESSDVVEEERGNILNNFFKYNTR